MWCPGVADQLVRHIVWSFCQVIYNPVHETGMALSLSPRRTGLMMLNALEKYKRKNDLHSAHLLFQVA